MTPLTLHPLEIAALPRKTQFTVVLDPQPDFEYDMNDPLFNLSRYAASVSPPKHAIGDKLAVDGFTLTITDVKVQRVQEITHADGQDEGAVTCSEKGGNGPFCPKCGLNRLPSGVDGGSWVHDGRDSFATLFDTIHGEGSYARNPWVAAYTFTTERNE